MGVVCQFLPPLGPPFFKNPYAIPSLIAAVSLVALALIAVLQGRTERINLVFAVFCLCAATASFQGVGTALGLSICHRIVEEHAGTIHVDSTLGSRNDYEG